MILTSLAIQVRARFSWTRASQASGASIWPPSKATLTSARRQKRRVGRDAGRKGTNRHRICFATDFPSLLWRTWKSVKLNLSVEDKVLPWFHFLSRFPSRTQWQCGWRWEGTRRWWRGSWSWTPESNLSDYETWKSDKLPDRLHRTAVQRNGQSDGEWQWCLKKNKNDQMFKLRVYGTYQYLWHSRTCGDKA